MTRPLKTGLIAGCIAIIAAVTIESALATSENEFFQFCTTKAYGWPAPWKIDYCECEGAKTTYPTASKFVNLCAVFASGIAGLVISGGISRFRSSQDEQDLQNKP